MLKYLATALQKRKNKPPHTAVSRCSLLSTCEGMPIKKHLLLGCGNTGMFQPVLLNLPFAPLSTEQYHIPGFCSHWQKTSDWSSWILLTGSNRNFSTLVKKTMRTYWSCILKYMQTYMQTWPEVQLLRYSQCIFHSWAQLPDVLLHLQLPDKALQSQKLSISPFT